MTVFKSTVFKLVHGLRSEKAGALPAAFICTGLLPVPYYSSSVMNKYNAFSATG